MKKLLPFFLTITITLSAYTSLSAAEPEVLGTITWEFRDYGDKWNPSIPLPSNFGSAVNFNELIVIFTCTGELGEYLIDDNGRSLIDFYANGLNGDNGFWGLREYTKNIITMTDIGFIARCPSHIKNSLYDSIDNIMFFGREELALKDGNSPWWFINEVRRFLGHDMGRPRGKGR